MTEVTERLVRVETRLDGVEKKLCSMSSQVQDIHTVVVCNNTNMTWVKKLLIIVITCIIGGGTVFGYKSFAGGNPAVAKTTHEATK